MKTFSLGTRLSSLTLLALGALGASTLYASEISTRACEAAVTSTQLQAWTRQYLPRGSNGRPAAAAYFQVAANGQTERQIYALNSNRAQAVASTQKMIMVYTAYKNGGFSHTVTWNSLDKIYDRQGKPALLASTGQAPSIGQSARASDYLWSLITNSSNGAALALSRSLTGSTKAFMELMNETARDLIGSQTSHYDSYFQNPAGLTDSSDDYAFAAPERTQHSTADNMARFMGRIMSDSGFRSAMAHNGLPYFNGGVVIKVGYTKVAGDTEIVYIPLPGCPSKALAYAVFGEGNSAQWQGFRELHAQILKGLGYR